MGDPFLCIIPKKLSRILTAGVNLPATCERLVIYMENKIRKKSINTVIYLLLAAMLVCMVLVSVYTVASKRKAKDDGVDSQAVSSAVTDARSKPEDSIDTKKTSDTKSETTLPSESASADVTSEAKEVIGTAVEDDEKPISTAEHYFVMPVDGFISKAFEIDIPVWSATMCDYRAHTGADIASPVGSEVIASSSGRVCKVWSDPMMGRAVMIDHGDEIYTTYMNLGEEVTVSVGDKVGMGQTIGCVGSSSLTEIAEEPHLHLEMKINGKYVDPLEYMSSGEYQRVDE